MSVPETLVCLFVLAVTMCAGDRSELIARLDSQLNALTADVFEMRTTLDELRRQSADTDDKGVRCNSIKDGIGVTCHIEEDTDVSVGGGEENSKEHEDNNSYEGGNETGQGDDANSTGGAYDAAKESDTYQYYQLELREVRGEFTPQGRRLVVQFWTDGPDDEIDCLWNIGGRGNSSSAGMVNNSLGEPGLREAYIDLDHPYSNIHFVTATPMMSIYLSLTAAFQEAANATELPVMSIRPLTDIVYNRGDRATFEVFTRNDGESGEPAIAGDVLNLNAGKIWNSGFEDLVNVSIPERLSSITNKRKVIVNTDEEASSGVVRVFETWFDFSNVVTRIMIVAKRVLRPSDQRGPYPEGFLHSRVNTYGTRGNVGNSTMCNVEELEAVCYFRCIVFGEDILNVTATEIQSSGEQASIVSIKDGKFEWKKRYNSGMVFALYAGHYGVGERKFVCEGRDSGGNVTRAVTDFYFYQPAKIVRSETRIEVVNASMVVVYCGVQGSPEPDISFYVSMPGYSEKFLDSETLDRVDGNTVVSTVTLDGVPDRADCLYEQFKTDGEQKNVYNYKIPV